MRNAREEFKTVKGAQVMSEETSENAHETERQFRPRLEQLLLIFLGVLQTSYVRHNSIMHAKT